MLFISLELAETVVRVAVIEILITFWTSQGWDYKSAVVQYNLPEYQILIAALMRSVVKSL